MVGLALSIERDAEFRRNITATPQCIKEFTLDESAMLSYISLQFNDKGGAKMRSALRFAAIATLIIACLVGIVAVSYHLNLSWVKAVPGGGGFRPYALSLWDWLMAHLLVILAVLLAAIALVLLTGGRRGKARHAGNGWIRRIDHGAEIARRHLGRPRSPEWPRVEQEHRLREPACVACGYRGRHIQVHHIKPFHLHPQLELDPDNLITLCQARGREHHLLLGHLDSWESYNEHVRHDAKHFYRKSAARIRDDLNWQKKMAQRP